MPRWFVQLIGERMDLTEFPRSFPNGPVYAVEEKGTVYLTGTAFEKLSDATAVREEASKPVRECSAMILLEWPAFRPPTIGAIERENEAGGRDVDVLLEGVEVRIRGGSVGLAVGRSRASGIGEAIGGPPQEPQSTSAQKMLQSAAGKEHLQSALRWFSRQPPNADSLFKVLEAIEKGHFKGRQVHQVGFCSQDERKRFILCVNSPHVLGDGARHAVGDGPLRLDPMDLQEAVAFIRRTLVAVLSR